MDVRMKNSTVKHIACLILIGLGLLTVNHGIVAAETIEGSSAHHDLTISLFPEKSEPKDLDQILIQREENGPVHLLLSTRARIQTVRVGGRAHPYTFIRGRLILDLDRIDYSYLAFSNGLNRVKGTWEVNHSPVLVRWKPDQTR